MSTYNSELETQRIESSDSTGYDVCTIKSLAPACNVIKQRTLTTLIDTELIREYAAQRRIAVSKQEADAQWQVVFRTRFRGEQAVVTAFLRHVHMSRARLRAGLVNDQLQQKVLYDVTRTMPTTIPAVRLSEAIATNGKELKEVKRLLAAHVQFLSIVNYLKHTSSSGCASNPCGDLGWIPNPFIPQEQRAVVSARVGSVLGPYLVGTQYVYFQVEGHNARYTMTPKQQFERRQQLFSTWLQQREHQAKVKRYVAV